MTNAIQSTLPVAPAGPREPAASDDGGGAFAELLALLVAPAADAAGSTPSPDPGTGGEPSGDSALGGSGLPAGAAPSQTDRSVCDGEGVDGVAGRAGPDEPELRDPALANAAAAASTGAASAAVASAAAAAAASLPAAAVSSSATAAARSVETDRSVRLARGDGDTRRTGATDPTAPNRPVGLLSADAAAGAQAPETVGERGLDAGTTAGIGTAGVATAGADGIAATAAARRTAVPVRSETDRSVRYLDVGEQAETAPPADRAAGALLAAGSSAAEPASPAQPAAAPPAAARLVPAVLDATLAAARSPGGTVRIVVRLDPPELGNVALSLTAKDGALHLSVATSSTEAAAAVTATHDALARALGAEGIDLSRFVVTDGGGRHLAGNGDNAKDHSPRRRAAARAPDDHDIRRPPEPTGGVWL